MKNLNVSAPALVAIPQVSEPEPDTPPAVEVRVARSIAQVEALRELWLAWNSDRDTDIDFCLQFVWKGAGFIRPHLIAVYRNGRPDAMLVGRLEHSNVVAKVGYVRMCKVRTRLLTFECKGILGNDSPENCKEFVKSILNALQADEAEAALLHDVPVDSAVYRQSLTLPNFVSRDRFIKSTVRSVMKLPSSVNDVYRELSAGHRSELRRKEKKILKEFQNRIELQCIHGFTGLEQAISEMEHIAAKSYQRALGVGFRDDEQMRRRLRLCAEKGWLRIYLLSLGEKPSAFWAGTIYKGIFSSDYLSFDTEFSDYSPGMFLFNEMIKEFCQQGIKGIDFGAGEGRYKERFGNSHSKQTSIYIYAFNLRGLRINLLRTTTGLIDGIATKILQQTNLLKTLKKVWRSHLTKRASSPSHARQ